MLEIDKKKISIPADDLVSEKDATPKNPRTLHPLLRKIQDHTARVGVVGLGYVGLPFAVEKAKVGYQVIGIDKNVERVGQVNRGENYISDVNSEEFSQVVTEGRIRAVSDFSCVADLDVIVICVPTPLTKNHTPNLKYVQDVALEIRKYLRPNQLVSLESTTYPGTTEEILLPILEESGLKVEIDFFLAHSPERVDPGNKRYTTKNTTKVVGGVGPRSTKMAGAFYIETIQRVVSVSNASSAELVKVFENTFRAVNIALVNELAMLCDRMGLNVWEVLDAAFTKPFGILPFYPGPGVGGHCIPIDPHYLEWKAREFNFETHFISLAGEINRKMPEFVREKTLRVLNKVGNAPSRSRVLILGVAYKKDLADYRESPSMDVLKLLAKDGVQLTYHDPFVPSIEVDELKMSSVELSAELVASQDLVLILTDHSQVDYEMITREARQVLDTRYATRPVKTGREKVTLL